MADRAGLAYRVEHLVLDPTNRQVRGVDIAAAIIDTSLTLTIEGASTLDLTVLDVDLKLLRGDLLTGWAWGTNADDRDEKHWILDGRAVDAKLDDLWFRLVKVSKQSADMLVLTFEDRLVALLRAHSGARKVYRDNLTRAQFVKALCNAADVPTHIPELNKRQPIAKASQKVTEADRTSEGKQGLDKSAKITIKGQKASRTQLKILERGLDAAMSLDPPEKALLALICAAIGESTVSYVVNSSGHGGPWQSSSIDAHDVEKQAHHFMAGGNSFLPGGAIKLARSQPGLTPGDIATKVEISGKPGSFYQAHIGEAKKILAAYGGKGSSLSVEVEQPYAFARGKNENSWDAIQRLAQEVNFRAFIRGDKLWYVSEEYLFAQKPQVALVEGEDAVDEITFDIDIGARNLITELQATVHSARWTLKAGMIGRVDEQGPADGRWVLHQVELALDGDIATATFNKPIPVKAEPAPETNTFTVGSGEPVRAADLSNITPKTVIDKIVLPIARSHGIHVTPASVAAANSRHGPTVSGGRSDHQGPPDKAWAADMSNGGHPTPQMDALAKELAKVFGLHWSGAGLVDRTAFGFKFQLIYRTNTGGNHFNHVHFGLHRV